MTTSRRAVLMSAALVAAAPKAALAQGAGGQGEFIGPLAGWLDVKQRFGAVGDGRADDSAALQRALDALRDEKGTASALYLPAGVYRITRTLVLPRRAGREAIGLNIQGEDPRTTIVRWDGPQGGAMFDYGAWYSKLGRITLDGAGRAGTALRHGSEFVTGNEIADMVFQDVAFGVEAGSMTTAGIAETSFQRCRFLRCSQAGVSAQNFNSLDLWFWHCQFEACRVGLTNVFGAGNFHAYACLFRGSTEADITIRNTGYLSFRNNTSIGSKAFFVAAAVEACAQLTFQGNRIFDSKDVAAIRVGNLGPVLLLDNLFASRAGAAGPVVMAPDAATIAVGNQFTVHAPLAVKRGGIEVDSRLISRASVRATPPALPRTPGRFVGRIVELAPTVGAAAIQAAIDTAAKTRGPTAIHLPAATYSLDRGLVIPAGCDVRLVGEGMPHQTTIELKAGAPGPVIRLHGPSRARIGDLVIVAGAQANGLSVEGCEGARSRVWMDQVQVAGAADAGFHVDRLATAEVRLRDIGHSGCKVGVRVAGRGEVANSPLAVILSGASSDNELSYEMLSGGRLLARDIWYETGSKSRFVKFADPASFTLNGSNIALVRKAEAPAVDIGDFRGRATFLAVCFTQVGGEAGAPQVVVSSRDPATNVLLLGCQGNGEYLAAKAAAGRTVRAASYQYTPGGGGKPISDVGVLDASWLKAMLGDARQPVSYDEPMDLPTGATDVRLRRVFVRGCQVGIHLQA